MFNWHLYPILLVFITLFSCTKSPEVPELDPDSQTLVDILLEELDPLGWDPLGWDPLGWDDQELRWLDALSNKSVVGLGEATHGTAEFFNAKHRIFRYLVENHGFKVFAFEADFGESIYINEAVQQGDAAAIESLMKSKMHFWTWKTEEVKKLLEWMCTYNQGKADKEKVHYVGVDCQFNTYHPVMAREYLERTGVSFLSFADSVLSEVEEANSQNYESFNEQSFELFRNRLIALKDSMTSHRDHMVAATSQKEFMLHERIMEVIRQVSEVRYYYGSPQTLINYRDKYMAENVGWYLDYLDNAKIAVWAHNFHISDYESGSIGTMGNYLRYALWDKYATIGFLFSRGEFIAVGMEGDQFTELGTQSLDSIPEEGSLNALMSHTNLPAFSIKMRALNNYLVWYNAIEAGMEYFFIGSAYNNRPGDYYIPFDPFLYHYLIYFDKTSASALLQ